MPKSKVIPSTATLVTLAILASSNARPSRAQQVDCLSLESSTACPAFQNYYIGLAGLATRYPYLANVTDITSFDSSLKAYAFSSSDYLDALGCTGYSNDSSTPYARYSLSRLCAGLVQDTASSLPCNYQNNIAPAPLCQTTCNDWLVSVTQITSDSSKCPNSSQRDNGMANLATQCANWQGYNGTASEGCIQGMANEPDNCGFQDDLEMACKYCSSNGTDSCCSNVSCHQLSGSAIAGIVIGCLIGAALIALAAFFFCARRKRVRNDNFKFTTYVPPRDDYYQTNGLFNRAANSSRGSLVSNHQRNLSTSTTNPPQQSTLPPPPPPPIVTTSLNDATPVHDQDTSIRQEPDIPESLQPKPEDLYMAIHPYPPQMGDELALHVGDIICLAVQFDDGWALGFNVMTGHKGAFPTVCVAPVPQDVLEGMLADGSSKTLVEEEQEQDQQQNGGAAAAWHAPAETPSYHGSRAPTPPRLNLDHIRESLRRSVTLPQHKSTALTHHSSIPKRTASIRTTYGYHEADSPTSPTLNTPFFDVTPLSSAVVRSPRNLEQRKQHQLQDEIELH